MKNIISIVITINLIFGINPPKSGAFPTGFWESMDAQGIGQNYGDPGWIQKINNSVRMLLLTKIGQLRSCPIFGEK